MSYFVKEEDFESIQGEWEGILSSCPANTIFLTPSWQRIWWGHFSDGAFLQVMSVRNGDEVLGVAPLMLKDGSLSFLGDTDLFDYHDFIVLEGKQEVFYDALWDYLPSLAWDKLDLKSVPEGSPILTRIPALARQSGMTVDVVTEDVSPFAPLPDSWDEYLAGLTKKGRHELRRKMRRLERDHEVHQSVCDNPDALHGCMEDFFRLLRSSSPEKEAFLVPEREEFFLDVALEFAPKGRFKLYFLTVDGARVASCICFDYGNSYLLYNSGYDPAYSALSVGLLNKALCIREAIEVGRDSFDFLRGTERYKYDLGGTDRAICRLTVLR